MLSFVCFDIAMRDKGRRLKEGGSDDGGQRSIDITQPNGKQGAAEDGPRRSGVGDHRRGAAIRPRRGQHAQPLSLDVVRGQGQRT
jgi:hypothetical protein